MVCPRALKCLFVCMVLRVSHGVCNGVIVSVVVVVSCSCIQCLY